MNARRHILMGLAMVVIVGLLASVTVADDLQPPNYRGQPNSAYAHFVLDGINGLVLDAFNFPTGGNPPYTGDPDGAGPIQAGGVPQIISHQPFTPEGGIWEIYMPNVVDQLPLKMYDIQITYTMPVGSTFSSSVGVTDYGPTIGTTVGPDLIAVLPLDPGPTGGPPLVWEQWHGEIIPNPDWEIFRIETPGDLQQVVIDTISVPEPASMVLLGMGGLLAMRRRSV